jgi:hypothetical protein
MCVLGFGLSQKQALNYWALLMSSGSKDMADLPCVSCAIAKRKTAPTHTNTSELFDARTVAPTIALRHFGENHLRFI